MGQYNLSVVVWLFLCLLFIISAMMIPTDFFVYCNFTDRQIQTIHLVLE